MTTRGLAPGIVTIALAAALGMACEPLSSSPASSDAPAAQASAPAAAACVPLDLRLPSGATVNLTGTWRGAGGVTFVRQVGSCVMWISLSNNPSQELGAQEMLTFHGEIASDFTLSGAWTWIVRHPNATGPFRGSVTFEIDPTTVNGAETLVLRSTTTASEPEGGGRYGAATLEYAGPLPTSQGL